MTDVAVVTGASSGIGAATAIRLAREGFEVVLGARRVDRLEEIRAACGPSARAVPLDVTSDESVTELCASLASCRVLVNNAGGALGLDPVAAADLVKWQRMYDTNVLGTVRLVRALLPLLEASGDGVVLNVGSVAGIEPYVGGGGYNAAKFAVHALTEVLRRETVGMPVRVAELLPGLVETEFSLVRFDGDAERAASVYEGLTPLSAEDVAEVAAFMVTRPSHVNLATVLLLPRDQASATIVHRDAGSDRGR
jgi:NADP-dependent 3-hydroxy acid dehydrogenase YdfG